MPLLRFSHLVLALQAFLSVAQGQVAWRTNNERVNELIDSMTPEEKLQMVHGSASPGDQNQAGYVPAIPRLGIPTVQLSDGEAGINVVEDATAIPVQLNVAATWSRSMAYAGGEVTGREARLLNMSVALAPRVNILRDPLTGNYWQSYSEDPLLNAQLGIQGVLGIQDQGTMANSKQIGPSSTGASAGDVNSQVDFRTLHEVYWSAHGALIDAGAATIMCSYAQINGVPSCQYDELMNRTLRGDFNFSGIAMSDWSATHSSAQSLMASLDWEMPTPAYYSALYNQIYVIKNLSESYLDRAVSHVLTKYDEFGLLDGLGPQGNSTATLLSSNPLSNDVINNSAGIAYDIAVRSGILLKNSGILPLQNFSTLGVIGPNGLQATRGTNFAERAFGIPSRQLAPVDALVKATSEGSIESAVGVDVHGTVIPSSAFVTNDGVSGLRRNDSANGTSLDSAIDFSGPTALAGGLAYTWTGQLVTNTSGYYRLALQRLYPNVNGGYNQSDYTTVYAMDSLSINGTEFDGYRLVGDGGARPWSFPLATSDGWDETGADVYLSTGSHNLTVTLNKIFDDPVSVRLCWVTPEQREQNMQEAVELAQTVDTAIVFGMALSPAAVGLQLLQGIDELISRVAAVNPNTVVVLNNAEPVLMPWLSDVSAVLEMGYPGQEGALAITALLLGDYNPQGRLPVTYPTSVNATVTRNPGHPERVATANGTAVFSEGLEISYRWYHSTNTSVLFPFGYGLSYTTFSYSDLTVAAGNTTSSFEASFEIANTGSVTGVEIPQLYLGPPQNATIPFASIALADFADVELAAGENKTVTLTISERQLSYWNQDTRSWILANGNRKVWVGPNVRDVALEGEIAV